MRRRTRRKVRKPRYKSWKSLSPSEKEQRIRALEVIRRVREGASLNRASKNVGIEPETVKLIAKKVLYKSKGKWRARKYDTIQRGMQIYENSKVVSITVKNSKTASLISEYMNDVKRALYSGDWKPLEKYKRRVITDTKGKKHRLETRPEAVKDIMLRKEEPEFYEIYDTN